MMGLESALPRHAASLVIVRTSLAGILASVVLLGHIESFVLPFYAVLLVSVLGYLFARGSDSFATMVRYFASPILRWRWAFVVWAILSLLWTSRGELSIGRATTLVEIQILGWVFYDAAQNGHTRWILLALFVSAFVGSASALASGAPVEGMKRVEGIFGNPNILAVIALLGLTAFYSGGLSFRSRAVTVVLHVMAIVLIATVVATASRKGVAGIVLLWAGAFLMRETRRRAGVSLVLALAAGIALVSVSREFQFYWQQALVRMASISTFWSSISVGSISIAQRSRFIEEGLALFAQSPIIGHGLESFRWLSNEGAYSHSNLVELGVSLGLVGVVLYYGMHASLFLQSVALRVWRLPEGRFVVVSLLVMLLMDVGTVSYFLKLPSLLLILAAGCVESSWISERGVAAEPRVGRAVGGVPEGA